MVDFEIMEVRSIISDIRLIVGGAAILAAVAMNHHIQVFGSSVNSPLVKNSLRVLVVSYVTPARENMAGEDSPCANIMVSAPHQPHWDIDEIPAIIRAMCAIEEYAISAFKSVWRIQINPVRVAPTMETLMSSGKNGVIMCWNMAVRRIRP